MADFTPLLVTIDTECDKSRTWHTSRPLSFRGVTTGIPIILQPLFDELGVCPTYLISYEVMDDPASVDVLRHIGNCELGTHLHGEYVPPSNILGPLDGTLTSEMQWEYGPSLESQKLVNLTQKFASVFERKPRSFRAGRFGAGKYTGLILQQLGYDVDSSVTPHLSWESRVGMRQPDFRSCPELPYKIREDGNLFAPGGGRLLELPVTILKAADSDAGVWFRPWFSDANVLEGIVRAVTDANRSVSDPRPLVMMFHNMEVFPGASPYPQTIGDVDYYMASMRKALMVALECGAKPMTMAQYFDWREGRI